MKQLTLSRRNFIKHACAVPVAAGVLPGALSAMTGNVIKRTIPSSGEEISILGMGTYSTFSHATPMEQLGEVMQAFFDHGGQMIDSSPMYGPAEGIVGELLKTTENTSALFAATKVWIDGREDGVRQMNESMRLMGVETMDLMQIHNLRDWKVHLRPEGMEGTGTHPLPGHHHLARQVSWGTGVHHENGAAGFCPADLQRCQQGN